MLLQAYTPYSWLVELNAETQTIFLQISEGSNLIVNQTITVTTFLHHINQNVMMSKVQCPHSISRTCLTQEFGLVSIA